MKFTIKESDLSLPTTRLLLAIQSGDITDAKVMSKFAFSSDIGSTARRFIWDGLPPSIDKYNYPLDSSPGIVDILSSDAGDIGNRITISGLDADGYEAEEEVVINGINPVQSEKSYSRIFRAYTSGDTDVAGTVSVYPNGLSTEESLVITINPDDQQSLFSGYTIPKGWTGYAIRERTSVGKGKETQVSFHIRLPGGVFRTQKIYVNFENISTGEVPFTKVPELTDIEARGIADVAGTTVSAEYDIILIKE